MAAERKVWLNGELIPWENATVHILSHGFSRGSAIFEARVWLKKEGMPKWVL